MGKEFVEVVYLTVLDQLFSEAEVPGITPLFRQNGPCAKLFEEAYAARDRLIEKYSMESEDPDMVKLIDHLSYITHLVGVEMFRCGVLFGPGEVFVSREGISSKFPPITPKCWSSKCKRRQRLAYIGLNDKQLQIFLEDAMRENEADPKDTSSF